MNVTGVQMATQVITGVTSLNFDSGGSLVPFSGDGDRYNTTVVNDFNEPEFSLESADLKALNALTPGTRGVFTATINDAKNGITALGGGFTITTAAGTAIVKTHSASLAHRQYGKGTLSIMVESADGTTNPASYSPL